MSHIEMVVAAGFVVLYRDLQAGLFNWVFWMVKGGSAMGRCLCGAEARECGGTYVWFRRGMQGSTKMKAIHL